MSDTRARIVEQVIEKWRTDGEDAKARGYLEAWNTYHVCANDLAALRDLPAREGQEEKEDASRVDHPQYDPPSAGPLATASDGQPVPPDDDWRRFCVNHEGYSGPTSVCPACVRRR
jgi:hypothetical protein